jgi:hypothetical protein
MWKYVILALFLIIPLARGTFLSSGRSDFWEPAALDKSYAAKFINNSLCSKGAEWNRACTKAIHKGLTAAGRGARENISNFEEGLKTLDSALPEKTKSQVFGSMVNEYLSVFDPHAKILPIEVLNHELGGVSQDEMGVESYLEIIHGRPFARLKIKVFRSGVCEEAGRQLTQRVLEHPIGIILDLRGNGGGRSDEARCLFSLLSDKPLPIERKRLGHTLLPRELDLRPSQPGTAKGAEGSGAPAPFAKFPLVVLVDAKSGSVTEMVAAGIQDTQRGWLVGDVTFGKGTFQLTQALHFHDRLRLVHSVFEINRANGIPIHYQGVTPNFLVTAEAAAGLARVSREVDLFPPSAKPKRTPRWRETRPGQKNRIYRCVMKGPSAAGSDHQLVFAAAVILCDSRN